MEPFLATIQPFGFNFAPRGWAQCQGQIISIAQNTALFALLGTQFGGNGQTTFQLPDLRGRTMVGVGQGPGLQNVVVGQAAGQETVTLLATNMPQHVHPVSVNVQAYANAATAATPGAGLALSTGNGKDADGGDVTVQIYGPATGTPVTLASQAGNTGVAGGSQPFDVRNPYLGLNVCIAMEGIFPSRD